MVCDFRKNYFDLEVTSMDQLILELGRSTHFRNLMNGPAVFPSQSTHTIEYLMRVNLALHNGHGI